MTHGYSVKVFGSSYLLAVMMPDDGVPAYCEFKRIVARQEQILGKDGWESPLDTKAIGIRRDQNESSIYFTYYLDATALKIGEDRIIRYIIAIESGTGARNVLYEGIRCKGPQHKTYSYGTIDKQFVTAKNSDWSDISGWNRHPYRKNLFRFFFCDAEHRPRDQKEILRRVKYGHASDDYNPDN